MSTASRKVLLPLPIEEKAQALLREKGFEVVVAPEPTPRAVAPLLSDAQAVILRSGFQMSREVLGDADSLLTISRTGGLVDNIDIAAATEKGILVTCGITLSTRAVVEHSLAMILALFKQLYRMDREVRKGDFVVPERIMPRDLHGKTLGVVGFGRVGSGLARLCSQALGMKVIAHDPVLAPEVRRRQESWVRFTDLEELFREADVVSLHVPLTEETLGMVDLRRLKSMKPDAFLVNTSRGEVVREEDLARALREGVIAGAGLDVFEMDSPPGRSPLLGLENLILTPRTAGLTQENRVLMAVGAASRVIDLAEGFLPEGIVNPEVLYWERWRALVRRRQG
jgi:D-3-phosphoglycerate dehydrogenase / 2-oxoglutarate reductase